MKKSTVLLTLMLLLCCLAGCGQTAPAGSRPEPTGSTASTESTASTASADNQSVSSGETQPKLFRKGIWGVNKNGVAAGLYYFSETCTECSFHGARGEGGIPFDYEIKDGGYVFHMGGAEDNTHAQVTFRDDTHATVTWADGTTEELVYIIDSTYDDYYTGEGMGDIILK